MTTMLRYLGYPLLVPRTLIGCFVFAMIYKAHSWRWSEGCIECIAGQKFAQSRRTRKYEWVTRIWGSPGAQTWGFVIVNSNHTQMMKKDLRVHERRHVWQAIYTLEIGFLLVYGGHYLWGRYFEDGDHWVVDRVGYVSRRPSPDHLGTHLKEAEPERWRRAYLKVIWERWANRYQRDYLDGYHAGAWGSSP